MWKMPSFDERKATEAAAVLIDLNGGEMNYMKLIKLIYLADRQALSDWERPITYDSYVSMHMGQVLSNTYDLAKQETEIGNSLWAEYISAPENYTVRFNRERIKIKKLSDAEINLLREIYNRFKNFDRFELGELTHNLPEYKDPGNSSTPTPLEELLAAIEYSEEEIERIKSELDEEAHIDALFGV